MQELQMKNRFVEVMWDTSDGNWNPLPGDVGLPSLVAVPDVVEEEDIGDWLSDKWGYCHFGWSFVRKEQVST